MPCTRRVLAALAVVALVARASAQPLELPAADPVEMADVPMQYNLWEAEQLAATLGLTNPLLRQELSDRGIQFRDDPDVIRVHVEVIGPDGATSVSPGEVLVVGGDVGEAWENRLDCLVPIDRLSELAASLPSAHGLELATVPVPFSTEGEGPYQMNARGYRRAGFNGSGVTIAVIDAGFFGLGLARTSDDAPPESRTYTKEYAWFFSSFHTHGTRVLEVLYDFAPLANYRLYTVDSLTEYGKAVDDAIANGAHFINHSMGYFNTGWADDSGGACKAADRAADAGLVFFTAAGNQAQQHLEATFNDAGANRWHVLPDGSEEIRLTLAASTSVTFHLQWDSAADSSANYDLYLYKVVNGFWVKVGEAASGHGLFGWNVFETLTWTNTSGAAVTLGLGIKKHAGGNVPLEVFSSAGTWASADIEPAGSTASPANSIKHYVVSVGAIDQACYDKIAGSCPAGKAADPIESYSSRGNANGGTYSVSLAGPSSVSTSVGQVSGTSFAAPAVTGVAAIVKSAKPSLTPHEVLDQLEAWALAFKDYPPPARDRWYGYGAVLLPEVRVDVNPGGQNVIKLIGGKLVTVKAALLGTATLDVTGISNASVKLHYSASYDQTAAPVVGDVNNDGRTDVLFTFGVPDDFPAGDVRTVDLIGEFTNGFPWGGNEEVRVVAPPRCDAAPAAGCRTPAVAQAATLMLSDVTALNRDRVVWKWIKGAATAAEFGDPVHEDSYVFCVWDGAGLVNEETAPAADTCGTRPCWKPNAAGTATVYRDAEKTPDGLQVMILKPGTGEAARITVKGKGDYLSLPGRALVSPVTAQLQRSDGGCWEAVYSAPFVRNDGMKFADTAD
jgi:hypothetical protein